MPHSILSVASAAWMHPICFFAIEDEEFHLQTVPALGCASKTITDASSLLIEFDRWESALMCSNSSYIVSRSSAVLSWLLRKTISNLHNWSEMTLIEKCHLYFIYEVEFDRLRDFGIERHENWAEKGECLWFIGRECLNYDIYRYVLRSRKTDFLIPLL